VLAVVLARGSVLHFVHRLAGCKGTEGYLPVSSVHDLEVAGLQFAWSQPVDSAEPWLFRHPSQRGMRLADGLMPRPEQRKRFNLLPVANQTQVNA
jgi:hypothetical protein